MLHADIARHFPIREICGKLLKVRVLLGVRIGMQNAQLQENDERHMTILRQMRRSRKKKSDTGIGNPGFSLVEVVIVVTIVIVIAGIAIPKLLSLVRELRTAGDARDLNGAIVLAKMRAASNFARARVYFDLSANTFHIEYRQATDSSWKSE